jgi:hypothetical protein
VESTKQTPFRLPIGPFFHGTDAKFDDFKAKGGMPIWFANSREFAGHFGAMVIPVRELLLLNPLVYRNSGYHMAELDDVRTVRELKKDGHDGVVVVNDGNDLVTAGAFSTHQIVREPDPSQDFGAWFSGSRVTDSKGAPLTVYHGTDKQFSSFSAKHIGQATGAPTHGFWFTNKRSAADFYHSGEEVGGRVIASHLRMTRPLEVSREEFAEGYPKGPASWAKKAREEGYDGAIIHDIVDGDEPSTVFAVFEPEQISTFGPDISKEAEVSRARQSLSDARHISRKKQSPNAPSV